MANIQTPILDLDELLTDGGIGNPVSDVNFASESSIGVFQSDEIFIDTIGKIFYFKGAGNLATAGTGPTGQALYSLFKERWKTQSALPQYDFPMLSITNEQFEIQNGWKPANGEEVTSSPATDLTFTITGTDDTIASTSAIDFSGFTNKDHVVIKGSTANDGYYRVKSSTATTLTLDGAVLLANTGADAVSINVYKNAVYQGGEIYTTRQLIRTAGWSEVNNGQIDRRYSGVVTLGTFEDAANDQAYYVQDAGFSAAQTNTSYTGPVNQAVQFYGNTDYGDTFADDYIGNVGAVSINPVTVIFTGTDIDFGATHSFSKGDLIKVVGATTAGNNTYYTVVDADPDGDGNSITVSAAAAANETVAGSAVTASLVGYVRDDFFKIFVRERGKTYADADLADIGVSELTYIVYRFPVTNATDLNIKTTSDTAFTGATISSISAAAGTVTVVTTAAHGLYVGAPVDISGTGQSYDGVQFTVTGVSTTSVTNDTLTFDTVLTGTAAAGTTKLGGVDTIQLKYLAAPSGTAPDVVIKGDYTVGVEYFQGDVVFDVANSEANADGPRWFFVDGAPATGGVVTTGSTLDAENLLSEYNFTLWDPATTYAGALGGQRNIEDDKDGLGTATSGNWSAYTVELDANDAGTTPGASKEAIYEYTQYLLRQSSNINENGSSSARKGLIADPLVFFVGSILNTFSDPAITTPGPFAVVIDDISSVDVNNIQFNEAIAVTYNSVTRSRSHSKPIVVSVSFNFNDNLVNDGDAVFYAYYTTGENAQAGNDFGTATAIQLQRTFNGVASNVGSDITPTPNVVPDSGVYEFNYAFDGDTANGRSTSSPVPITVVAIGLERGQYVITTGSITNAGGTFSLVAPLERNYTDPA